MAVASCRGFVAGCPIQGDSCTTRGGWAVRPAEGQPGGTHASERRKVPAKNPGRGAELRRADTSEALPPDRPEQIRNVALVGRSGSGKTMLAEALLAATGAISRKGSIAEGTTVSDSEPAAIHQQRSVALSVVPVLVDGVKVNLLDTPGYGEFIGELRAGLRAADAALFVVSAVDDIDAATSALWAECQRAGMPRAVVISRLDHPRADFDAALGRCQAGVRRLGAAALPAGAHGADITGLLGLLSGTVSELAGGIRCPRTGTPTTSNAARRRLRAARSSKGSSPRARTRR